MAPTVSAGEAIFGVDLGTSKACVATLDVTQGVPATVGDPSGHKVIPAVLSFHPDGTVLVGDDALPQRLADPRHTVYSIARLIGREASSREVIDAASRSPFTIRVGPDDQPLVSTRAGDMSLVDVCAFMLEHVRRYAELAVNTDSRRCVLTAPAFYDDAQKQALHAAGTAAGFEVERILADPLAVATSWAYGRAVQPIVVVYDFGGGKCEVSVVEIRGREPRLLGTAVDTMIGGDDLDRRIVDFLCKAFWQVHRVDLRADALIPLFLRAAAERAKIELATKTETTISARGIVTNAAGQAIDLNLVLTRDVLANAVGDIVQRTFDVSADALAQAGLGAADANEILLVGGPTRMPFIREQVAAWFGRPPRTDVHPDEGVALGAAIWGAHGGLPDPASLPSMSKRVTAQFGSDVQQAKPSEAAPSLPSPARVGRVHTKRMFTAVVQAVKGAGDVSDLGVPDFSPPTPVAADDLVKPQMVEVMASRLALSTVGGFCDEIIARDLALPIAKTRVFSTGKDLQRTVKIQVCQGDSRRFVENTPLGTLVLDGLPALPRGAIKVEVTFSVDAEGVLVASARDQATGRAQTVEIRLRD
jgi:molecular chaperone DnaK